MMNSLGQPIPVASIRSELKKLWADNDAMTKASLMNFVVYGENHAMLEENSELVQAVVREHACRAILVGLDPSCSGVETKAWVTAHCHIGRGGGKSICSEQLAFAICGESIDLLRNLVFAHLESDLPLVFWWQGDFSERFEPQLYSRIDKLVIDSATWEDPVTQYRRLLDAYRDARGHVTVLDLLWIRLLPYRLAIAGCFDAPQAVAHIPALTEVSITHATGDRLTALMLLAWIAKRLGWKHLAHESATHFLFDNGDDTPVRCTLEESGTATLSAIKLKTPDAAFSVSYQSDAPYIQSRTQLPEFQTELSTPQIDQSPASLVIERLQRGANTRNYFSIWKLVAEMIEG